MSSVDTALQPPVARDQARALFGQTMGLVAVTCGFFALGAYLGRDLSYGWGLVLFIASFGLLIGINFAVRRSEQLAIGLLFGQPLSPQRTKSVQTLLLQLSVIGLGAGMDLHEVVAGGLEGLFLSALTIIGTLLVGSVRLTPVRIGETPALLLGPLTIEPPFRDKGIGKAMMERALKDDGFYDRRKASVFDTTNGHGLDVLLN